MTLAIAGYLIIQCSVLHVSIGLIVSLSEPGAEFSHDIILNDSPRSISLVLGRTYSISCEGTEWHRNGELVTATSVIDGVSGVYVVSSGDVTILMLQLFNKSLVGQYSCKDENGKEFVIHITAGNPVLVPSREVMGLEGGFLRSSLPFFSVFGSGDPQPEPSDYSWYFNGDSIFVNGAVDSSVVDVYGLFDRVTNNRITLKQRIDSSIEGTYVSVVNTTAGEINVTITMNVEAEPDPDISVVQKYSLATGRSIVFNCSDSVADPIPSFSWSINSLHGSGSAAITFSSDGRESYLTVAEVDTALSGVEVICNSSNVVEEKSVFKLSSATFTAFDTHECESICHRNATCTILDDDSNCSCNPGFSGDGFSCKEMKENLNEDNATHTDRYNCTCNDEIKEGDSLQLVIVIGGSVIIVLVLSVVALIIALAVTCCQKRNLREICRKLEPEGMNISPLVRQQSPTLHGTTKVSNTATTDDGRAYEMQSSAYAEPGGVTTIQSSYELIRM